MKIKLLLHVSGEIGTKGKNRIFFERKLAENIRRKIEKVKIKRAFGSFLLEIEKKDKAKLKQIPGIAWIAEAIEIEKDLKVIKEKVLDYAKTKKFKNFDIEVKRQDKSIAKTSQEIRQELIKFLIANGFKFKPKSRKIFIELNKDWWLIYSKKEKCLDGLPTSTSGRVIALVSGGIDSSVASFLAMKKGLEIIFVHFHNYPSNNYKVIDDKIIRLIKKLNNYQIKSKVYIISFVKAQQEIIKKIKPEYRMLVYRWLMLKIASTIARKEKALALITGDSLGQVASQTLSNLTALLKQIEMPVLMPLLSFNKNEIIEIAKKIGTYEISIMPYADCCSFMIAKHPATKINEGLLKKLVKKISKKVLNETLKEIRIEIIK